MTGRITIEIDCFDDTVAVKADVFAQCMVGIQAEHTRAAMIGAVLAPRIRELMQLPTDELRCRALGATIELLGEREL